MKARGSTGATFCLIVIVFLGFDSAGFLGKAEAQPVTNPDTVTGEPRKLVEEHVYGGLPSKESLYTRNAYVLCYIPGLKNHQTMIMPRKTNPNAKSIRRVTSDIGIALRNPIGCADCGCLTMAP